MVYGELAFVYDYLMQDLPYSLWIDYMKRNYKEKGHVLEIACGTGSFTLELLSQGYQVTATDISDEMLSVAQEKLSRLGHEVPLFSQDMIELDLGQKFDAVAIFCDSLNYVLEEEDVQSTFHAVYEHLHDGGYFFFDVHSMWTVHELYRNKTYTFDDEEDVALIWHCFPNREYPDAMDHEMTFFVKDKEHDYYHRFEEFHVQRTLPIDEYKEYLVEAGFEIVEVVARFGMAETLEEEQRIFFTARKPMK